MRGLNFMKKWIYIFITLLFFLPFTSHAADWKTYPYNNPDSKIVFPDDEGSHAPVLGLEWWYVVIHAVGETTGDKYSILVTHFSNQFRFFTVTNVTQQTHKSGTTLGLLNSKHGSLNVKQTTQYGTDYMRTRKDSGGNLIPFEYEFETNHSDMHIKGQLKSLKPPMMVGGDGYVPIGSSGNSWYYSLTRLDVDAVLTYNGITERITGLGWFDHQWGEFLVSPVELYGVFETYEWFCVQLDNGAEIMISNIFDRNYNLPYGGKYGGIQYCGPDGYTVPGLTSIFTRTGYWQDPASKNYMSMGWTLEAPAINLKLTLTPEFKSQMVKFPLNGDFWEGSIHVNGTLDNVPVTGRAFGELMHRYEIPKLTVSVDNYLKKTAYKTNEAIEVGWKVRNPDQGNPLTYDVDLVTANLNVPIAKGIKGNSAAFTLADTVPAGSKIDFFRIKITAYSVDKVIQGSSYSPYLMKSLQ
jgi:predicted secreted hydrolase